jgi:Fe2+ or Zn2+ uptake regulation protein
VQSEHGRHWTAQEVFLEARKRRPTIGFATVHRGLIRLRDLAAIMKIEVPGRDAAWYEAATRPHAHFLCVDCHAVVDVDYHTSRQARAAIAARSGLEISDEIVTFRGRCSQCAARALRDQPPQ